MAQFLNYFIGDGSQWVILASSIVVWFGLMVIGAAVGGRGRLEEGDFLVGWAVAVAAFTVPGVFLGAPFTPILWLIAALAAVAVVIRWRREGRAVPSGALRLLILGLPLLLLASARMGSEWDEFSQWIPASRFMLEDDSFPVGDASTMGGTFSGYPYGWLFLGFMANRLGGQFVESAGAVFNVLLLFTFGLAAVRLWFQGAGREAPSRRGWIMCAFAILAGTLLNPTFVQKVVLTFYADTASGVAVGVGGVLAWMIVGALADDDTRRARRLAWQFGLVMVVLVNVKQANLVLFILLLGAAGIAALRDPAIRLTNFLRLLPAMVLPAIMIYGVWRYHVLVTLPTRAEAVFLPFEAWNLHILGDIFFRMLVVAGKKGVYFGLMAVAVAFGIRGLVRCATPFDRLALIVGGVFLGYNAFLYLIFVTQFGEYDALRVASYWRYNLHLGPLAVVFAAYGLGVVWRKHLADRPWPRALVLLPIALVLIAPMVFAKKLRFDLEQPKPFYRSVAAELPGLLPEGSRTFLLDPLGSGQSMVLSRYGLWNRRTELVSYFSAFHGNSAANIRNAVTQIRATHILVHSVTPAMPEILGVPLVKGESYLLAEREGSWRIVHTWQRSETSWKNR